MANCREVILMDDEYLTALLDAINNATQSIDMQVYIFENDEVGQRVADALCEAGKRGVCVRLLVDGVGTLSWGGSIAEELQCASVVVKVYHPLPWKIAH